jgi:FixJ family two-component response regulator
MTTRSQSRQSSQFGDPLAIVVDDDEELRLALSTLFRSVGLRVELFASATELLSNEFRDAPRCLVLDVRLPGLGGLDLQSQMAKSGIDVPLIFVTGRGDIPMSVQAMKAGAVDFLTKPFRDQDMLDAVAAALDLDWARHEADRALCDVQTRYQALTIREKQVMALVTSGLMNKQVAAEVRLSEITVKIYRGQVMKKMSARSFADLVRMAERLGLSNTRTGTYGSIPKPSGSREGMRPLAA